uniref:hypothetical protein n=1 Tax=Flavobacterium sp. TaxID=239 RepID=UPI004049B5CC
MSKENSVGGSIMVVPFRFQEESQGSNGNLLLDRIKPFLSNDKKGVFSSDYYPNYCDYHLGNAKNLAEMPSKDPYLKFYNIDISKEENINSGKSYIKDDVRIKSDYRNLHFKLGQIQLVLNGNAQNNNLPIGFWVFNFEWINDSADVCFDILANSKFFRYHGFDKPDKSSKIFIENQEETTSLHVYLNQKLNLAELDLLEYYQNKPTILHLLPKGKEDKLELGLKAYKTLRIPPPDWNLSDDNEQSNLLKLKEISLGSYLLSMDEGAVVLEKGAEQFKNIKNKYFPAFILAVNQREVLSLLSEMTAANYVNYQNNNYPALKELRSVLVNTRYHQIFHTISKNSEINLFYHELQNTFLIEEALKDLQESLDSLNELFAEKEAMLLEKERGTKEKRNIQLGYVLSIITVLGIFSAYNDLYDLFELKGKISPHYVWPVILGLIIVIYAILKKRSEKP